MVFTSPDFIFYFLPIFGIAYGCAMLLRRVTGGSFWLGNLVIFLFSLVFYYWGEVNRIGILIFILLVDYIFGLLLDTSRPTGSPYRRKAIFGLAVVLNIGTLFVFKYLGFASAVVNDIFPGAAPVISIALPLGISFFIFQGLSYVIDVYRGTVAADRSFIGFACYLAMFPQLVAGPIVRYADIAVQLRLRNISCEKFAYGVERFSFGLAKKVLVANQVAIFADTVFALQLERISPGLAWMGTLCYAIQIYFDFSGYSDMAIGMGKMLGFDFKENFRHPYAAISIQDFWRRWHISLSTWFRDYLYIPLGGNRKGEWHTYFNLCVVFVLCGLWHGAAVNFILWGAYHGFFLIIERMLKVDFSRHAIWGRIYTILVVLFGWLLFRAESFEQIAVFLKAMLFMVNAPLAAKGYYIWLWLDRDILAALAVGIVFSFPVYDRIRTWWLDKPDRGKSPRFFISVCRVLLVFALLMVCVPFIVSDTYNPFIYFRF